MANLEKCLAGCISVKRFAMSFVCKPLAAKTIKKYDSRHASNIFGMFFVRMVLRLETSCSYDEVFKQRLWMRKYGVLSWKPTTLWSNSWHIAKLDMGPMTEEEKKTSVPLAHVYNDKKGVKRCTGKKRVLKESQRLVCY